jgi:N-acetylglucosamine-6-sulfatase
MEGRSQLTTRRAKFCIAALTVAGLIAAAPAMAAERPNLVLINTDDQTLAQLRPDAMPNVTQIFGERGFEFTQAVTEPQCCPSRAGYLTGQYPHNHGVFSNRQGYRALTERENTLPVWLKRAGYRTGLVGKFLNQYSKVEGLKPAPGFTTWFNLLNNAYYGARVSKDGKEVTLGDSGGRNHTDNVLTRRALGFIRHSAQREQPFFLWLSYHAPHAGGGPHPDGCQGHLPVPAPEDVDAFSDEPLPQPPSYDEANMSDKPSFMQDIDPLDSQDEAELTQRWRCGLESLGAADRGVGRISKELRRVGEKDNTVMVFTSDNGFQFGEHRLRTGKGLPYEESARVPLLFRGPRRLLGGGGSGVIDLPVSSIDLAPTFLRLAKARPCAKPGECRVMDGRSLLPLMDGHEGRWPEDRGILLQLDHVSRQLGNPCTFDAIRTPASAFHRYRLIHDPDTGECLRSNVAELYDLSDDPFELSNLLVTDPSGSEALRASLAKRLRRLRDCAGIKGRDPKPPRGHHCE